MANSHWNYFLAIEDDIVHIGRYVEFVRSNYGTYSIEMARILMAATQEVDVLLKQICTLKSPAKINARKEQDYRKYIPTFYPNFKQAEVQIFRYGLCFTPFANWGANKTPEWWTANNDVKHQRHSSFNRASLENTLNSACALLIANLYYHDANKTLSDLFPGTTLLFPKDMVNEFDMRENGIVPIYKVL